MKRSASQQGLTTDPGWSEENAGSSDDPAGQTIFSRGRIVFESNEGGRGAIYSQDGSGRVEKLIATNGHCLFPAPSPCGRYIAYAEAESSERTARSRVLLYDLRNRTSTVLAEDGTFPNFSADGTGIYVEYHRSKVIRLDLKSGERREIFCPEKSAFGNYQIAKVCVTADESTVYVTTDRGGRWNVWGIDLRTNEASRIGSGCEPVAFRDGSAVIWVSAKGKFSGTEITVKYLKNGLTRKLITNYPARFQYYPSLVADDRYLLCSASQPRSLFRRSAKYQILAVEMQTGNVQPIQSSISNCRWARLLPSS